jgi:hypothetical protein
VNLLTEEFRLELPLRPPSQPTHTNTSKQSKSKKKKTKGSVRFETSEITGISRPLSSDEHWTLYYFESHAIACSYCKAGSKSSRIMAHLCGEGIDLAQKVATLTLSTGQEGEIFSTSEGEVIGTTPLTRTKSKGLQMRVEIPFNYKYSRRLLRTLSTARERPSERQRKRDSAPLDTYLNASEPQTLRLNKKNKISLKRKATTSPRRGMILESDSDESTAAIPERYRQYFSPICHSEHSRFHNLDMRL